MDEATGTTAQTGAPAACVVAVRALCEFTAKAGDLDLRFTPSPSALEGMAGHQAVTGRRPAPYDTEITLRGEHAGLQVRGRADGYDPAANRLDEIKTHRGDLSRMPGNQRALHWAQARIYGWLMCEARGLASIELALVYYDIGTQAETVLVERHEAHALRAHFIDLCTRYLAWARQEAAHRAARDAALTALRFPHADFRTGQRTLAEAVYRVSAAGRCLLAQAPTGIGKTLGTLFPMLKAMPGRLDKVFFLTAKTPGRQLALDASRTLRGAALPLRVVELVARDKACEHPDRACHGESCPLARGFYDRLPAARAAAVMLPTADRDAVRAVARAHAVCPYYLAQELARWADVVVGDYNYWFDLNAMLAAQTLAESWRVGVLVDEAHNLVDRVRAMYSATLRQDGLRAARHVAPKPLRTLLDRVRRHWNALAEAQESDYASYGEPPAKLLAALQQVTSEIGEMLAEAPDRIDPALLDFFFDALHFGRVAELFSEASLFDLTQRRDAGPRDRDPVLCLRNVVPAAFVRARLAIAHTTTLFSATLQPERYHRDMLGLPADTPWIDVPAPFAAAQLAVHVARHVSTRYADRARSVAAIVELLATQFRAAPGNYLAFFSSYDYLTQVADAFAAAHPDVTAWRQARRMDEDARAAFLARFAPGARGIGFAVLGGAFAEGIDLPGERLIGAFIATLGLPQVNPVNEGIRARMQASFAAGYDYTYLYPGLQKVVQAAGRVIRTPADRGVVHLMDDRFARREVQALLPTWWRVGEPRNL